MSVGHRAAGTVHWALGQAGASAYGLTLLSSFPPPLWIHASTMVDMLCAQHTTFSEEPTVGQSGEHTGQGGISPQLNDPQEHAKSVSRIINIYMLIRVPQDLLFVDLYGGP